MRLSCHRPRTGTRRAGRVLLAAALLGGVSLFSEPAAATTVLDVPMAQMARESHVIVRARVEAQDVRWDKRRERILTFTRLSVLEAVKGAKPGEQLTVYQVGGELDGKVMRIPGAVELTPGEEIVFFAVRHKDWIVSYGMGLGKYRVFSRDGKLHVAPAYGDVSFMERAPDGRLRPASPDTTDRPLEVFLGDVRRALGAAGGAR